jgi:hypothetical protein
VGVWRSPRAAVASAFSWRFWLFAAFVLFSELRPLRVPRGDADGYFTTSTMFAFALLLQLRHRPGRARAGPGVARR